MKAKIRPVYLILAASFLLPDAPAAADYSTPYAFSTLAGVSSIGSQDGTGNAARFYSPRAVAADTAGNAFIVDTGNHTIRKVTPTGVVTTFAGLDGVPGSADGTGANARFDSPQDIAADSAGNLFVTDTGNHTIRKVTPAGVVTTFAGHAGVDGNGDGSAAEARFHRPLGIAVAPSGDLFVTQSGNGTIRRISPTGNVSTYATHLGFTEPSYCAIAVDAAGTVYVAQFLFTDHDSYYVGSATPTGWQVTERDIGFLTRVPPEGTGAGGSGIYLLQTTVVRLPLDPANVPSVITDILPDPSGNLVLAGFRRIQRFSPADRQLLPLSGSGLLGGADGLAEEAKFSTLFAITPNPGGGFVVADAGNNTVRRVSAAGAVTTVAGIPLENAAGAVDATGGAARFAGPAGMVADAGGNLYVADTHCIRRITPEGTVTTLAGKAGTPGSTDGTGAAARFNNPAGVAMGPSGYLYVADTDNNTVRRVSLTGEVTTVAGTPPDSSGTNHSVFSRPQGIAVNALGTVFVADTANCSIRMIMPDGTVQTYAGLTGMGGTDDGAAGRFTAPHSLAFGPGGDLYVTDYSTGSPSVARIRKINPNGSISTVAGVDAGYADGTGTAARFHSPDAITADTNGNLFVADSFNQTIRKVTATGAVTTIAGLFDAPGSSDGAGREARFYYPRSLAVDLAGNLYVGSGTTVRKGIRGSMPVLATQPVSQSIQAGGSAIFSVSASGTPSPAYQWQRNGNNLAGATASSLNLANVGATDAGDYTVVVTNALGSVTSAKATLAVTAAPVPPPPVSAGGGGGGAPSPWFLVILAGLRLLRHRFRRLA